jgi:hypothetical protein
VEVDVLKGGRRISYPIVGYLLMLLQFAVLGTFVAALAFDSGLAAVAGVAWVACLVASLVCFRVGARQPVWSEPLGQRQIDQYYANFRAVAES